MKPLSQYLNTDELHAHVQRSLEEDLGRGPLAGDHSSRSCLEEEAHGLAVLRAKEPMLFAGVAVAEAVLRLVHPSLQVTWHAGDGDRIEAGKAVAEVRGSMPYLLGAERTLLNYVQRLSGIATLTASYVAELEGLPCQLLDTRKTTPGWRMMEKWAVQVGGGANHRIGLYDMIMLKDNHIDLVGGITEAVNRAASYMLDRGLALGIEVECRNLADVHEACALPMVQRIMLDNFTPAQCREAVALVAGRKETEASGGITKATLRAYAEAGVTFISVGALTHAAQAVDLNFKASRLAPNPS